MSHRSGPSLFFAERCEACASPGRRLCAACAADLTAAGPVAAPAGCASARALVDYEGVARQLVLGVKYRNHRSVLGPLAVGLARLVAADPGRGAIDVVTWAPTTIERRRERGFDQSRLLARGVAATLSRPVRPLLRRSPGPAQTGRDRAARGVGPAFRPVAAVTGNVLVIDDVLTTGATLAAAAAALHAAGAAQVHVAALARTPHHPHKGPFGSLKVAVAVVDTSVNQAASTIRSNG